MIDHAGVHVSEVLSDVLPASWLHLAAALDVRSIIAAELPPAVAPAVLWPPDDRRRGWTVLVDPQAVAEHVHRRVIARDTPDVAAVVGHELAHRLTWRRFQRRRDGDTCLLEELTCDVLGVLLLEHAGDVLGLRRLGDLEAKAVREASRRLAGEYRRVFAGAGVTADELSAATGVVGRRYAPSTIRKALAGVGSWRLYTVIEDAGDVVGVQAPR